MAGDCPSSNTIDLVVSDIARSAPLIFDLFHTLADPDDFRPSGFRRLEAAAAVLGVPATVLETAWSDALADLVHGHDSVRGLLRRVARANGRPARTIDIAPAAEPIGRYQDLALLHPRPEAVGLLARLNDRVKGMLTNCHDRDIEAWPGSPLAAQIDHAVFSTKSHVAKPEPESYQMVLDAMGVAAGAAVYVGNGGDDELAGAAAAGIGTIILFTSFDELHGRVSRQEISQRAQSADLVARSFEELSSIICGP